MNEKCLGEEPSSNPSSSENRSNDNNKILQSSKSVDQISTPKREGDQPPSNYGATGAWFSSWFGQAKEATWSTLDMVKKDIAELSEAVSHEATNLYSSTAEVIKNTTPDVAQLESQGGRLVKGFVDGVSHILSIDDTTEGEEEFSVPIAPASETYSAQAQARLALIRSDPGTYCNEPEGAPELYEDWMDHFCLSEHRTEINRLLAEIPEIRNLYTTLVPSHVSDGDFWNRYFYRVHQWNLDEARRKLVEERRQSEPVDFAAASGHSKDSVVGSSWNETYDDAEILFPEERDFLSKSACPDGVPSVESNLVAAPSTPILTVPGAGGEDKIVPKPPTPANLPGLGGSDSEGQSPSTIAVVTQMMKDALLAIDDASADSPDPHAGALESASSGSVAEKDSCDKDQIRGCAMEGKGGSGGGLSTCDDEGIGFADRLEVTERGDKVIVSQPGTEELLEPETPPDLRSASGSDADWDS